MALLGPLGILFWVGLALFAAGHMLFWPVLAKYGGLERTKTLFVVFDNDSPMNAPDAKPDRWRFRIGVYLIGFGLVTFYSGLSTGEAQELRVCRNACIRQSLWGGYFAPSLTEKTPAGKPLRACWCIGPVGSVELQQDSLPFPPQLAPPGLARSAASPSTLPSAPPASSALRAQPAPSHS